MKLPGCNFLLMKRFLADVAVQILLFDLFCTIDTSQSLPLCERLQVLWGSPGLLAPWQTGSSVLANVEVSGASQATLLSTFLHSKDLRSLSHVTCRGFPTIEPSLRVSEREKEVSTGHFVEASEWNHLGLNVIIRNVDSSWRLVMESHSSWHRKTPV